LAGTWLTWLASSRRAEMIRRGEVVRHSRDSRRSRRTLDELPREMRLGTNEEENTCSKGGVRTATTPGETGHGE